jgi:hypothetical protein
MEIQENLQEGKIEEQEDVARNNWSLGSDLFLPRELVLG